MVASVFTSLFLSTQQLAMQSQRQTMVTAKLLILLDMRAAVPACGVSKLPEYRHYSCIKRKLLLVSRIDKFTHAFSKKLRRRLNLRQ